MQKVGKLYTIGLTKHLFRMDENMRHTFRRRRHTSNWIYTIVAVCFLLVTLCIISLIPGSSGSSPDNTGTTPSPGLSGDTVGSVNTEPTPPGTLNGSAPEQEGNGTSPSAPYITITINNEKFTALVASYQANASTPSSQRIEEIRLQLQELAVAREQLLAEREEFRTRYETASEALAAEKNDYLKKQTELQAEIKRLQEELNQTETQIAEYNDKIKSLDAERKRLSEEEQELQETETQLQHLSEDITHAREQLTAERRELESGIQNIKENPNLSSESKETALMPLYAALEQLLMRESQLEHSEAEYKERSEALLAQKENLATRLQSYEADRGKLDETLAPHKLAQQELVSAIQAAEAQLPSIVAELERIGTKEAALGKEYQDKLATLDAEEAQITQEEQALKKLAASLQTVSGGGTPGAFDTKSFTAGSTESQNTVQDTSEQSTQNTNALAQRTLERILIILQDVPLTEGSNTASGILLTDVADIMITTPEVNVHPQDVLRTPPDSLEADNSDSHK